MALTGILADVTPAKVKGLLLERDPRILTDATLVADFENLVRSAATQVVLLTGQEPPAGRVRGLALEAIAYQTASEIEYASYPEQQAPGEQGRGYYLHQRYLELLGELRAIITTNGGTVPEGDGPLPVATQGRPRGRFPEPMSYPDPARGGW